MALTPSQFQARLREASRKQQQAIDKINQQLRSQQRTRQQAIEKFNREAQAHNQKVHATVTNYNREVAAYNSRIRADRQRLANELRNLERRTVTTRYSVFHSSVQKLNTSFTRLDQHASTIANERYSEAVDLSERENANNISVMNSLLGAGGEHTVENAAPSDVTLVGSELKRMSPDLDARWAGAVFALSPHNPDAARHFCTSSREIMTQILEIRAPDSEVLSLFPNCSRTGTGRPTRRAKVNYFLTRSGLADAALEDFVENDTDNIVELFQVFNTATHGSAGAFTFEQLKAMRRRVEDAIYFLCRLSS